MRKQRISLRIDSHTASALDAIARAIAPAVSEPSRSAALLAALHLGIERIEGDPATLTRRRARRPRKPGPR